jgi:hypothetical protein
MPPLNDDEANTWSVSLDIVQSIQSKLNLTLQRTEPEPRSTANTPIYTYKESNSNLTRNRLTLWLSKDHCKAARVVFATREPKLTQTNVKVP